MPRIVSIAFMFLIAQTAFAIPVTWNLNNVEFDDGGIAGGSFIADVDTDEIYGVSVFTTDGTAMTGVTYQTEGSFSGGGGSQVIVLHAPGFTGNLFLIIEGPLTNSGGTVNLVTNGCFTSCEIRAPSLSRNILAGASVSAVPVPAAVWLFGSALAGLGWLRSKNVFAL